MKKLLVAALALTTSGAFAQELPGTPGMRHMLEFTPETMQAAVLSFDRIKTKNTDADSGANLDFGMNYAVTIHRLLQTGVRFDYFSGLSGANQGEGMTAQVGLIANMMEDFTNSPYASIFIGGGYEQQFGPNATRDDLRLGTFAVGKRFSLERFGMKHLTYSPELALQMKNSTNNESFDYSQSLQFRILQFSAFF